MRSQAEIEADCRLIDALGGPAVVARMLELKQETGVQTVHNWKTRGIPAGVKLKRPDLFLPNLTKRKARTQRASAVADDASIDMEPSGK